MNKPLLGSLVAATLLLGDASAATMYERFEAMEKEMKALQTELTNLKAEKAEKEAEEPEARGEDEEDTDEAEETEEGDDEAEEDDDEGEEEEDVNEAIEELQESVIELTKATSGNHLKLGVDFRTAYDNVRYKLADGSKQKNNDIITNRLWLNMDWAANENMSFTGQLAYNKMYGERFGDTGPYSSFEDFDWFSSTNPSADGTVRVKSAYWFYRNDTFLGTDIPWTFSLGRRPSTNGHLINFRDDDPAASPSGHTINVEFDGLSAKFGLEKVTGVEGMYIKLCGGQGSTNADEMFSATPYAYNDEYNNIAADDISNVHMAGIIFVPFDNGQYSIGTQFTGASNMPGQNVKTQQVGSNPYPMGQMTNLTTVGDLYTGTMYAMTYGIGDEWSDFLDDTTFFISGAMSRTNPDDGRDQFGQTKAMLGSTDMENGYSYWVGLNMPSLISEDGRFGIEFNHGSEYWRPITYAEDTMVGSKIAARGDAFEVYFTEPLLDDVFSFQIRYTNIKYDYSGSNGFFGNGSGVPLTMSQANTFGLGNQVVERAEDIRVYLRYRY